MMTRNGSVRRYCKVIWRTETEVGVTFAPMPNNFRVTAIQSSDSETKDTDRLSESHVAVELNS